MTLSMRPRHSLAPLMLCLLGGLSGAAGCSSSTTPIIPKVVTSEMERELQEDRKRAAEQEAEAAAARKEREKAAKQR